jgi:hypothetical protein
MKTYLNLIVAGLLLVLFVGTGSSVAHQKEFSQDVLPFANLTLEISSTKHEFLPLEPIPLNLELSNRAKNPVSGHDSIDFSQNHVELFVAGPDGSMNKIEIQKPLRKLVEATPKVYEPSAAHRSKQLITINPSDVLSQPGDYRIQAVIHGVNWYEEVKSNFLPVRIVEATGTDKQAFDYLRDEANISAFFAGFDFSKDQKALCMLDGLIRKFRDTVYAEYASFRLGEFYFYSKEYTKANEYFENVATKASFIFADKAKNYLEKIRKDKTIAKETP